MPLTLLPVTLVLAGALALLNLWLMVRIAQVRRAAGIWTGDGGDDRVERRMRAQANFIENAPFVLALVGLIEFSAGTSWWLWGAAALFLVARVLHPFGMDGWRPGRSAGAVLSMGLLLGLGLWAIALPFTTHRGTAETPVEIVPAG